jgi:prepilin-type N-terminal cleavage/methylation domain-containing protein
MVGCKAISVEKSLCFIKVVGIIQTQAINISRAKGAFAMLTNIKKRNEGFTIIEVLFVLAIAGLILLIVFLAVPALQRNARNTQRKNDVSAISSALTEYVENQGGTLPATAGVCSTPANCPFISNAKLGYYTSAEVTYTGTNTTAVAVATPTSVDKVNIGNYSTCNATETVATATGASARSVALTYEVETGSGNAQAECITTQ